MSIIHMENENFDQIIMGNLVLVDFYANWCGPCKMLSPILDDLNNLKPDLKIVKVNVDEQADIARQYGIMSIPTLLLFQNGQLINKLNGFQTIEQLLALIDQAK